MRAWSCGARRVESCCDGSRSCSRTGLYDAGLGACTRRSMRGGGSVSMNGEEMARLISTREARRSGGLVGV